MAVVAVVVVIPSGIAVNALLAAAGNSFWLLMLVVGYSCTNIVVPIYNIYISPFYTKLSLPIQQQKRTHNFSSLCSFLNNRDANR